MTDRLVSIHGWNVRSAKKSLGKLVESLESLDFEVILYSYGYVFTPWSTRNTSRKVAKCLSSRIREGDTILGHSNGGRIAWELSYYLRVPIRRMVLINPALDSDAIPSGMVEKCLVIHNKLDLANMASKMVPGSIWGDMGRV